MWHLGSRGTSATNLRCHQMFAATKILEIKLYKTTGAYKITHSVEYSKMANLFENKTIILYKQQKQIVTFDSTSNVNILRILK